MFGFEVKKNASEIILNGNQNAFRIVEQGVYNPTLGVPFKSFSKTYTEVPLVFCTMPLNVEMYSRVTNTNFAFLASNTATMYSASYLVVERITDKTLATHGIQIFGSDSSTLLDSNYPLLVVDGYMKATIPNLGSLSDRTFSISGLAAAPSGKQRYYCINATRMDYWVGPEDTDSFLTRVRMLSLYKFSASQAGFYDRIFSTYYPGGGHNYFQPFDAPFLSGIY